MTMRLAFPALAIAMACAIPASAADYMASLGPMPLDDETKAVIAGRGDATATIEGRTLTVKGNFRGLPSAVTRAYLFQSPYMGVPGKQMLELKVAGAASGTLSGSFTLTADQAKALRTGRLYVQINSEKAPPGYAWGPTGTLWGWLFPAHETAAQGVPQQRHWFIPQLDTPSSR
jgi:hypothetical protein